MAARGYNRYRGRSGGGGGRMVWIIVLVLILLAAVAFLVAQRYVVYDAEGKPHLTMFSAPKEQNNPISPQDVVIDREEPSEPEPKPEPEPEPEPEPPAPPARKLDELHARELPYDCLWWTLENTLRKDDEDIVIIVKRTGGEITYGTEVELAPGAKQNWGATRDHLIDLLQSGHYTVARINCFSDPAFARAHPDAALVTAAGKLWVDGSGRVWLDPGSEDVRTYLTELCAECAALGFNEILLDGFCYPATGDLGAIAPPAEPNKTAALTAFADALRQALPEDVAVSVTLRGDMGELGGDSGLTAELLASFDRIYVAGEVDGEALRQQLPAEFDTVGGLVQMMQNKPEEGSYALMS